MDKLIRVYMIGYEPPGWDMEAVADSGGIKRIMATADVCCQLGDGEPWHVGLVTAMTRTEFEGDGPSVLEEGRQYRCVRHDYDGKIAIVEPVED